MDDFTAPSQRSSPPGEEPELHASLAALRALLGGVGPVAEEGLAQDAPPSEEPDLHTLLSEMAALRQEVRLQNRQESRAGRELASVREALEANAARLVGYMEAQQDGREASDARAVSTWALSLLDIRDALTRGLLATQQQRSAPRPWWQRWLTAPPPPPASALEQGYRMALSRCDQALHQHGVTPIAAVGEPFDAESMAAVEVSDWAEISDGVVTQELQSGCMLGDRVLRCAQVVVNRRSSNK